MFKKLFSITGIGLFFVLLNCAGRITTLTEPTSDDGFVLIGSVIFQNNYFISDEAEVYRHGIDVAIVGEIEEGGKKKITGHWASTDKNGYFVLSNVPPGKYAIKAVRLTMGVQSLVTVSNTLRYSGSDFTIQTSENVIFEANYFGIKPKGRVVNLKHHIFMVDHSTKSNRQVVHYENDTITEAKLLDGKVLKCGPVEEYFIEKYPTSAWVAIFKEAIK